VQPARKKDEEDMTMTEYTLTGDQALKKLMAGNKRFRALKQTHPDQTPERRAELRDSQHPFATILGCSDSRVPPEVIFDQGLGDLFVVRVAGNIVDDVVLGSIEYSAAHLHTPLIMVLGHSRCGAVSAAVAGGELEGHLTSLTSAIQPVLYKVKDKQGDLVNDAAKANAKMVAEQLKCSEPVLSTIVNTGKLKVVAAYYDFDTWEVEIIS